MAHLRNTVAALTVLAAVGCIAFIIHAGNRILDSFGPSSLAVDSANRLYVVSHGAVHVFEADGQRSKVIDLAALGVSATPSAIAVLRDGRLMLAEREGPALARCDPTTLKCERLQLDVASNTLEHLVPGNSFKFHVDEDRGRIYVSDNGGNRLVITDLAGKTVAVSAANLVHFPNQVWSEKPGELTVVDTNKLRIATFDVSADRIGAPLREMRTAATDVARRGCLWPFDAARVGAGELWVLLAQRGMRNADVVVFKDGRAVRRVELGEDSDPFAIAAWGERIVVADATRYRLIFMQANGTHADAADAAFAGELRAAMLIPEEWKELRFMAQVGVVLVPLIGVIVLWRLGVPLSAPSLRPMGIARPAGMAPPSTKQIAWIEPSPAFLELMRKRRRNAMIVFIPLLLVVPVVFHLLYGVRALHETSASLLIGAAIAVVFIAIALLVSVSRTQRERLSTIRLGADEEGLRYVGPRGNPWSSAPEGGLVAWKDVYFDGFRLLVGRQLIGANAPLVGEVFPREALEREILSRIPDANFISAHALGRRIMDAAPLAVKILYWLMFAGLAAFLLRQFIPL
jgi:hypothetical protein